MRRPDLSAEVLTSDALAYLTRFQAEVIADALREATSAYWMRRAETFDWVPLPAEAAACRAHARVVAEVEPDRVPILSALLDEYRTAWLDVRRAPAPARESAA